MSNPPSNSTSPYNEPHLGSDHGQGPPRKKMRKGTKSCIECRRRKIKCTFEPGRPAVCNECYARGSTCIDQEHGDLQPPLQPATATEPAAYSLRERVSQLEDLVKEVLHRLPENGSHPPGAAGAESDRDRLDAQAAEVLKCLKTSTQQDEGRTEESIALPGGLRDDAPALTLFDNAVITRKDSQRVVSRAQYNRDKTILAALHKLLPSSHDLDIILESSHEWWAVWRKMFPEITDSRCDTIKESVSHSLRSEKPAELAKIMLCIAISIHQLPATFDWSRLHIKESPAELMERSIATVNKLITADDEIAATIDGLECMMLEAKYNVNMGRPRRAWLLFHRALAFAQLLGFHRLTAQADKTSRDYQRSANIWCHLVLGDRYLSLLLGLPYSVADSFVTPLIPPTHGPLPDHISSGELHIARMLPILTKISDRNQAVVPMGYSATLRLDQELEELSNSQDAAWWSIDHIPGNEVLDHFDRLQAHFLHHQAKVLLHMPFMLRASADKRYQYSHTAALEGSREMIVAYEALRSSTSVGPFICKLVDFQAFTAAMLLLLNLCGYSQHHRGTNVQLPDLEQDQRDSELIDRTITLLKDAEKEVGGLVAAQCAQALEMLAQVRHGCEQPQQTQAGSQTCQVSIPYFGTITIGMGNKFVPIKPGTYVQRRPGAATMRSTAAATCGLPTPPSLASNSTQQSPMSAPLDTSPMQYRSTPLFEAAPANFVAAAPDQPWPESDDPFVTFDSFLAFQPQPTDFPSAAGTASSGYTPQAQSQSPYTNVTNEMGGAGPVPELGGTGPPYGLPFAALPSFSQPADLDQGWNWFGVNAPVTQ